MKRLLGFWNWLTLPGGRAAWSQTIHLGNIPKDQASLREVFPSNGPIKPIDFVLSDRLVLRKTHVLPRKARPQAANILKLRSDALSSSSQSDLTAASVLKQRGRNEDKHEQYLVRTTDLTNLRNLCSEADIPLRSISVEADGQHVLLVDQRKQTDQAVSRWWGAAATAAVLICLIALYAEVTASSGKEQNLASLRAELGALQQRLDTAANNSTARAAEEVRLSDIVQTISEQQRTVAILQKLTVTLSKEVWLTELAISESRIRISGVSGIDPISVIANLESEPWVSGVTLARPVRTDSLTQLSNFELVVDLEVDAL